MKSKQIQSVIEEPLSHTSSWREAIERTRFAGPLETDSEEEASAHASYWEHELKAFDSAFAGLACLKDHLSGLGDGWKACGLLGFQLLPAVHDAGGWNEGLCFTHPKRATVGECNETAAHTDEV